MMVMVRVVVVAKTVMAGDGNDGCSGAMVVGLEGVVVAEMMEVVLVAVAMTIVVVVCGRWSMAVGNGICSDDDRG